ncbi:MAG: J domain-containing protein [Deltaproteobacteria bacterium]|nr:J domain-containing protein [Deltaproteobacteria bacterium]
MALNHYLLLGIPPEANHRHIKAAYRSLAKRFHPDRNKGSETAAELFRQVNLAYRVLSNPKLRELYDKKLALQSAPGQASKSAPISPAENDPQKFKKFINSLLDALFGPLNEQAGQARKRSENTVRKHKRRANKPDFNFYYHLATEKENAAYQCGEDGVFRRARTQKKPPTKQKFR